MDLLTCGSNLCARSRVSAKSLHARRIYFAFISPINHSTSPARCAGRGPAGRLRRANPNVGSHCLDTSEKCTTSLCFTRVTQISRSEFNCGNDNNGEQMRDRSREESGDLSSYTASLIENRIYRCEPSRAHRNSGGRHKLCRPKGYGRHQANRARRAQPRGSAAGSAHFVLHGS